MPIPDPHVVRTDVPEAVSAVVMRALERDPDTRFATAQELGEALRDAARRVGVAPPSRDELARFVRKAGGEALDKIRDNIKRALANTGAATALASAVELVELTPSATSGVVERSGATDPTTGARETTAPEPDASAPGPAARMPSDLLVGALEPEEPATTLMERAATGPTEARTRRMLWIGLATLALVAGALGAMYLGRAAPAGTAIELEATPAPHPEPVEPHPDEPVRAEAEAAQEPEPAQEPAHEPEVAEPAAPRIEESPPVARRPARTARPAARAGATAEEVRAATLPEEPARAEPAPAPAPAPTPTRTDRRPRAEPAPAPTTMRTRGLAGVDAFDRELERRQ